MNTNLGFARAVREHGDYWRTGIYLSIPATARNDNFFKAILLSSYEYHSDTRDSEEMLRLTRRRAEPRLPEAA